MDILVYKGGISNEGAVEFLQKNNIKYDTIAKKKKYDYIVKPPGIVRKNVNIEGKIICDIELVYMIKKPFIIGITATAGKTSTTLLINELLKRKYNTVVAGNIGIPFGKAYCGEHRLYILELSSFELESCSTFKPRIAVMLNISDAHLDYHETMDNYIKAKEKITINQDEYDFLIYNFDDVVLKDIAKKSKAIKRCFSLCDKNADAYLDRNMIITKVGKYKIKDEILFFEGDICNAMASILVAELTGIEYSEISDAINNMHHPKYRMEQIYPNIYNDAKSTNVLSTIKQIKSFKNVHLICGGYDRGNNLDLMKELFPYVDRFYLYGGNAKRVSEFLDKYNVKYKVFKRLKDATFEALKEKGTIILSPMAPSYDQYSSYLERGNEFEDILKKWFTEPLNKF